MQVMMGQMNVVGPRVNHNFYLHLRNILPMPLFFRYQDLINTPGMKPGLFDPLQLELIGSDDRDETMLRRGVEASLDYYLTPRHNMVGDVGLTMRSLGKLGITLPGKLATTGLLAATGKSTAPRPVGAQEQA